MPKSDSPAHWLILVKHAPPQVDPNRPTHDWVLSDDGRAKAKLLAERLRPHAPTRVVTSTEPKAIETGEIVARLLGIPIDQADGLEEYDRSNVPVMRTSEFISAVAQFFKERDRLVLGRETAAATLARFHHAIDDVIDAHPDETVAVVTHGTVLALYAAALLDEDPYRLWRQLGHPSFVVLDRDELTLVERVDRID